MNRNISSAAPPRRHSDRQMSSSKTANSEMNLHTLAACVLDQVEGGLCSLPASWDRHKRLKYCYRLLKSHHNSSADVIAAIVEEWPPVPTTSQRLYDNEGEHHPAIEITKCVNAKNEQLVRALSEYAEVLLLLDHEDDAQLLAGACDSLRRLGGAPILTRKDALHRLKCRPDVADLVEEFTLSGCIQRLDGMKADL